jgi:hypothetical protein
MTKCEIERMMVTQEAQEFLDRFIPYPPFISKGAGVIRKVPLPVIIVVVVGLYL